MEKELKTSEEWQKECTIIILDPDGWDRKNYNYSWYEEKITRLQFENRMTYSTVQFTKPLLDNNGNINSIWKGENIK